MSVHEIREAAHHARIRHRSVRVDRLGDRRRAALRRSRRARARPFRRVGRGVGGEGADRAPRRPRRPRRPPQGRRRRRGGGPPGQQARLDNPAARTPPNAAAVETIAEALVDTGATVRARLGVAGLAQGRPSTEQDPSPFHGPDAPRGGSENLALDYADRGVRAVSARFAPTVHGAARPRVHRVHRRRGPREGRLGVRRRRHPPLGGRAPARTPRGWSGSGSSRRLRAPACTPSPRRACRRR